jgi:hypothetical protein
VTQLEGDAVMSYALQAGLVSGRTFSEASTTPTCLFGGIRVDRVEQHLPWQRLTEFRDRTQDDLSARERMP